MVRWASLFRRQGGTHTSAESQNHQPCVWCLHSVCLLMGTIQGCDEMGWCPAEMADLRTQWCLMGCTHPMWNKLNNWATHNYSQERRGLVTVVWKAGPQVQCLSWWREARNLEQHNRGISRGRDQLIGEGYGAEYKNRFSLKIIERCHLAALKLGTELRSQERNPLPLQKLHKDLETPSLIFTKSDLNSK